MLPNSGQFEKITAMRKAGAPEREVRTEVVRFGEQQGRYIPSKPAPQRTPRW